MEVKLSDLKKKFDTYWFAVKDLHELILDTYVNNIYEENWDRSAIVKFGNLIGLYNENMKKLYDLIYLMPWDKFKGGIEVKNIVVKRFELVYLEDLRTWNSIQLRRKYYEQYRKNRRSIILSINNVLEWVSKEYKQVLEFFITKCEKVPLYKDVSIKLVRDDMETMNDVYVKVSKTPELSKNWLKKNRNRILDEIENDNTVNEHFMWGEIESVFYQYVKLRKVAYNIFCGITSAEEIGDAIDFGDFSFNASKGIGNYQYVAKYCQGVLQDKMLKNLVNTYREYVISYDDEYQQIMDMRALQFVGMNESYPFTDYLSFSTPMGNRDSIKSMSFRSTNVNVGKICSDGRDIFAMTKFKNGDIIEVCPCRDIRDVASLYSRDIRDMMFHIRETDTYVVPMGYCQYYAIASEYDEPNCSCKWDAATHTLVIRATRQIEKGEKLVLLKH